MFYPEGMKARVSPVQSIEPHRILAPTRDLNREPLGPQSRVVTTILLLHMLHSFHGLDVSMAGMLFGSGYDFGKCWHSLPGRGLDFYNVLYGKKTLHCLNKSRTTSITGSVQYIHSEISIRKGNSDCFNHSLVT